MEKRMYYPDLSLYQYSNLATHSQDTVVLNIGWLDAKCTYPKGQVSAEFLDRLFLIWDEAQINPMWGYHQCELCEIPEYPVRIKHGGSNIPLGATELRVVSPTGIVYASPDLVLHYISEHKYLPPSEFIEAVMNGPLPSTSAYKSVVKVDLPE